MNLAQTERAALVETLRAVGPDAPTLCAGWSARDLAAHLVMRERRLDASPGIMVKALSGYTEKVQKSIADNSSWDALVNDVADGPPIYSPFKLVDRWANLSEMFVHHEDLLRGGADPHSGWTPRALDPAMESALLTPLKSVGKMTLKSSPASVTLRTTDGVEVLTGGSGAPVSVTGTVGELLLFAFGRSPGDLAFDGDSADIDALKAATRGF